MKENDFIVEKIKKLIAMTSSSNENEVFMANKLISKLLNKHNLDINEIENIKSKNKSVFKNQIFFYSLPIWQQIVIETISKFYDCRAINDRQKKLTHIIGFKEDTIITIEMINYIINTFKRIALENTKKDEIINTKKWNNSFYLGASSSLAKRLIELKSQQNNENVMCKDLVVVKKHQVDNFVKEEFPKLTQSNSSISVNRRAYNKGVEAGEKINLNSQVDCDNTNTLLTH